MKKQIEVSIGTPCTEDRSKFLPTAKGGFCQKCTKEVIDFSKWSDQEVYDFFKKGKPGTCGMFRNDQLRKYGPLRENKGFNVPLLSSFLGLTALIAGHGVQAQGLVHAEFEETDIITSIGEDAQSTSGDKIHIKGKVEVDDSTFANTAFSLGETPLTINDDGSYSTLLQYNGEKELNLEVLDLTTEDSLSYLIDLSTKTEDSLGQYSIEAPNLRVDSSQINELLPLTVESYELKKVNFDSNMVYGDIMISGFVVTEEVCSKKTPFPKRTWEGFKKMFKKGEKDSSQIDELDTPVFVSPNKEDSDDLEERLTVYPNPVTDKFYIQRTGYEPTGILQFRIVDERGIVVSEGFIKEEQNEVYVDANSLLPGVYLILVYNDHGFHNQLKFVKL